MRSSEMRAVAGALVAARAPGLPSIILAREVPLFEVEFAALEFAEEAKLSASDWAALALARALGEVTPADVDSYLGLGEAVSEGLIRRLIEAALLEERAEPDELAPPSPQPEASGVRSFFLRLFGAKAPPVEAPPAPERASMTARKLRDSRAATSPICTLSTAGAHALERGGVARRRVRPARLTLLAEPLLYLGTVDEKRHRHAQHRRPRPLEPDRVPESLRVLDTTLSLPPEARGLACGIETGIRGFAGHLVGIVPGAQWEVRPVIQRRRGQGGSDHLKALLIAAAFPSSDPGGLRWHAYLRQQDRVQDCSHLDVTSFVDPALLSVTSLLNDVKAEGGVLPVAEALRSDGAFELRCDAKVLPRLIGDTDRPGDAFLLAEAPRWWVGLRVHAQPADDAAARAAFYELLGRRDPDLRRDFDATCAEIAAVLLDYWAEAPGLPTADEAAEQLWVRAELRAALCMRRLRVDLVTPYADAEAQP